MPVDNKLFNSEVKRLDSEISGMKKSQEKYETDILKRFDRVDIKFDKMDARFEKLEAKMDSNFRWLIGTHITLTGIILAAFYAFATLLRR
jgi:hypothetical protein